MAIDSREKRQGISGIPSPVLIVGVTPNASPDQEWRQEVGGSYPGIEASEPSEAAGWLRHRIRYDLRKKYTDA